MPAACRAAGWPRSHHSAGSWHPECAGPRMTTTHEEHPPLPCKRCSQRVMRWLQAGTWHSVALAALLVHGPWQTASRRLLAASGRAGSARAPLLAVRMPYVPVWQGAPVYMPRLWQQNRELAGTKKHNLFFKCHPGSDKQGQTP